MDKELIEATQKAIGYNNKVRTCKKCKYFQEVNEPEGKYDWVCTYSNICQFTVGLLSCCDKFEMYQQGDEK